MDVTETLRDAAYIAVGASILGFQKAQVRRRELVEELHTRRAWVEAQMADGRTTFDDLAARFEEVAEPVVSEFQTRVEALIEQIRHALGLTPAA